MFSPSACKGFLTFKQSGNKILHDDNFLPPILRAGCGEGATLIVFDSFNCF